MNLNSKPVIVNECVSVKDASKLSGYSKQYLRRLIRERRLQGLKIGQVWLVGIKSLEYYIANVGKSQDRRFGPR
jgi:hypothetical protein